MKIRTTERDRLRRRVESLVVLSVSSLFLFGCGPSQAEVNAKGTQTASSIFATMAATAPISAPSPIPTSTQILTPTNIPKATFTPRATLTPSATRTYTRVPPNTYQPTNSPSPTPRPTPTETRPSAPTETPSTGDIHGKIHYECNDEPVVSASAALFIPGEKSSYLPRPEIKDGEFWMRNLQPGVYNLYWSFPSTPIYSGEGKSVKVERGKTLEITLYIASDESCPLLRLIYPEDHQVITTTKPEFRWEEFRPGSWYIVTVGGIFKDGFALNPLDQTQETSYSYATLWGWDNLIPGQKYFWEVCAFSKDLSDKICSIDRSFTVASYAR